MVACDEIKFYFVTDCFHQTFSLQTFRLFSPIFSDLKILKLHDLFQLKLLAFVYESVHKISPTCFHNFFKSVALVHQYGTRQASKDDIFLTQKNTNQYGLRSIHYHGSKCWNDIPVEIKRSPSVNIFRQRLKAFLFENNY